METAFSPQANIPPDIRRCFGELYAPSADAEGYALSIPPRERLVVRHCITSANTHYLIHAGKESISEVFMEFMPDAKESLCTVEVLLESDAVLHLLFLQQVQSATVRIIQRAKVADCARLHIQNVTLDAGSVVHDLAVQLDGAQAESTIDWVFHAKGQERHVLSARNTFNGRAGKGEITMKGVAEGWAFVTCDGMIEIGEGGGATHTHLTEDALMLDTTAKVDAVPALEIRTNDVQASHSATVSRVSEADIFYFAARGIPANEARRMYVEGFLADVLRHIQVPEWRHAAETALLRR